MPMAGLFKSPVSGIVDATVLLELPDFVPSWVIKVALFETTNLAEREL